MKNTFRNYIIKILWWQVARLRAKHNPKIIAVAGSIGKTTTKSAIAHILSTGLKVKYQTGNYNDIVSVPSIFFGYYPKRVINPFAWLYYLLNAELSIIKKYPYDVVLLELGVDKPGDMAEFKKYLQADYGVLTAIAPEHLEALHNLETVAKEELLIADISEKLFVDIDSIPFEYRSYLRNAVKVSSSTGGVHYEAGSLTKNLERELTISYGKIKLKVQIRLLGRQNIPSLVIATVLAAELGLDLSAVKSAIESFAPFPGRMSVLAGKKGSILIDDSYNASPEAVKAALDSLYEMKAKQKIAVLGQMNELGDQSAELHKEIGAYCRRNEIDLIVTVGDEANKHLALAAEAAGCKVFRANSPYHAAEVVTPLLHKDTVVLLKGSQGGIFIEEATKLLLADEEDSVRLVRQSESWMKVKKRYFKDIL